MALKKVVIVGKPNVGKSQLFNRLTGERHSVVYSKPGITRDRVSLEVNWFGKRFILVDTGGYTQEDLGFQDEINRQTEIALSEADLILLVTSVKEGITEEDIYLAKVLKKKRAKNILVAANKCDVGGEWGVDSSILGFGEPFLISAEHGINTGELLEQIVGKLGISEEDAEEEGGYGISIIGRPNVGKSSLVNALLGEDRVITSEVAGTTRDAIDLEFSYMGKTYKLIDTPGIRRHASVYKDEADKFSLLRAKKSLQRADMVWLVLDISDGINELDERIGGLIWKANIPSIIVVNKCDLLGEDAEEKRKEFEKEIRNRFRFLS